MKKYITLTLLLIASTQASKTDFIEKYSVDSELQALLDDHVDEIARRLKKVHKGQQKHGVWKFDWLPGYYVKYGLARIRGMEKMKKCIETHDLHLLTVPDKKIYHLKGRPTELSGDNYAVIIRKVERISDPEPLTLEQVQQLCTIIRETKYISMTSSNFIRGTDGLLHLIDTEATFSKNLLVGFVRMITTRPNLNTQYTKEALMYVFEEIKECLKKASNGKKNETLKKIAAALKRQKKPYAWDYREYVKDLFAKELA